MSKLSQVELNEISEALDRLEGDDRVECYGDEDKAIMLLLRFIEDISEEGN